MSKPDTIEAMKDCSEEQSEAIAVVAHQLRSPLSSIKMLHEYLLANDEENLTEMQLNMLEKAQARLARIEELAETLIAQHAEEYTEPALNIQTTSIEALLNQSIEDLRFQFDQKQIAVTKLFAERPYAVQCDQKLMKDAVLNLLDNAAHYTEEGGSVTVSTQYEDGHVIIKVKDTGCGVTKTDIPQLFMRRSRMDNTKDMNKNGAGLGLYIVRNIVERHCGTVVYDHNEPKGSIFTITMPITRP